jgi:T5SS/PEP-CTERM-associated repeat protein
VATKRVKRLCRLAAALGVAVQSAWVVSAARAADYTWNNPGGGDYATGTNWTPSAPAGGPGNTDRSVFNLNNVYTVTFAANVENAGFQQSQGDITFNIGTARTYTVNSSAFELGNTALQSAALTVSSGAFVINSSTSGIGTVENSSGTLTVSGAGTSFSTAGYCDVGIAGSGAINVIDGASASIGGGSFIASAAGSLGVISASGSGTTLNLGPSQQIGRAGTGILNVEGAAANIGGGLVLGWDSLGSGTLNVGFSNGSTTVNSAGMTVGYLGAGALNFQAGTLQNAGAVNLAANAGANASATVGAGTTWNQSGGSIYVGGHDLAAGGQALLTVNGTLAVTGSGNGVVIRGSGVGADNGTLNLAAGLLSTPNLTRDPNGVFNFTGGTLQINGGTLNLNQAAYTVNGGAAGPTLVFNGLGSGFAAASTNLTVGSTDAGSLQVVAGAQPAMGILTAGTTATGNGTILVSGTGSRLSTSGNSTIGGAGIALLTVESGGTYAGASDLQVRSSSASGTATVTVTGAGSQLLLPGKTLTVAQLNSTTGTVNISNGGSVSAVQVFVGASGGRGTLNVSGPGSSLIMTGPAVRRMFIGNTGGTASTATFGFGATVSGDFIQVFTGSTVNLNGATLTLTQGVTPSGGTFNFNSGTLTITNGWVADLTQIQFLLGSSATLGLARTIQTGTSATLTLQSPLTLDGGTLNAGSLVTNGQLNFVRGTLGITGSGGLSVGASGVLGDTLNLTAGRTVNVNAATTVAAGGMLVVGDGRLNAVGGITNSGEIRFPLGAAGRITGGTLNNQALVRGDGRIDNNLTNAAAGELRATDGERLLLAGASNTNNGEINLVNGGTVEFTAALTNSVTGRIAGRGTLITGGTLTNNGQIAMSAGFSDVFAAVTNNNDILITGGGTTTFYNPITNAAAGNIFVAADSAVVFLGAVTGTGTLSGSGTKYFADGSSSLAALDSPGDTVVESPAQVSTGYVRERSLDVRGAMTIVQNGSASGTSRVNAIAVRSGGRLDLKDNKLIAAGAAGDVGTFNGSTYSGLTGQIASTYNFSSWDGSGILTSMPAAGPTSGITTLAIATADETFYAGGTFGGVAVDSGDVLVMYTYAGDLNLDGLVDGADYGVIDNSVQFPGTSGYVNGDFNYDGAIDGADYGIIDNTIQLQGAPFPGGTYPSSAGVTAVPEPALLPVLGVAAAASWLGQRRHGDPARARRRLRDVSRR